jgi:hypothetical protein
VSFLYEMPHKEFPLIENSFMFHQANLRVADLPTTMVNGLELQLSLIETWTEIVTQEMVRL